MWPASGGAGWGWHLYLLRGEEAGKTGTEAKGATRQCPSSLTCSHSTAHSGWARICRSSRGTVGGAHTCSYMLAGVRETRLHTLSSKVPCGDRASISSTSRLLLHPMLPQADSSCHSTKGRSSLPSRSQETNWENMEGSNSRPGEGGMQGCM